MLVYSYVYTFPLPPVEMEARSLFIRCGGLGSYFGTSRVGLHMEGGPLSQALASISRVLFAKGFAMDGNRGNTI